MTKRPPNLVLDDEDMNGFVEAVGARLLEIRKKAGLTQLDLAEKAGVSRAYIFQLESGRANFTLKTLGKIAILLGVDAREILPEPTTSPVSPATLKNLRDRLDRIEHLLAERQRQDAALMEELKDFPKMLDEPPRPPSKAAKSGRVDRKPPRQPH